VVEEGVGDLDPVGPSEKVPFWVRLRENARARKASCRAAVSLGSVAKAHPPPPPPLSRARQGQPQGKKGKPKGGGKGKKNK
jgi:hypothetical protein